MLLVSLLFAEMDYYSRHGLWNKIEWLENQNNKITLVIVEINTYILRILTIHNKLVKMIFMRDP